MTSSLLRLRPIHLGTFCTLASYRIIQMMLVKVLEVFTFFHFLLEADFASALDISRRSSSRQMPVHCLGMYSRRILIPLDQA